MSITIWVVLTTTIGIHEIFYGTFVRGGCETAVVRNCELHLTVVAHKRYWSL